MIEYTSFTNFQIFHILLDLLLILDFVTLLYALPLQSQIISIYLSNSRVKDIICNSRF